MSKEEIKAKEKKLLTMVETFAQKNLNEEYKELCIKLVKKLGRKHDVPFKRGKLEIWASAVVYAIGQINFLFDKSFEPYVMPDEICDYFNTKKSTVSDKARKIRDMFKMGAYDEEFSTKDIFESNPLNNYVMTDNGLIVPKSMLYEDIEENHRTFLNFLAEKQGLDEEVLKELLKNNFMEQKGSNIDNEELELFMDMILTPIPESLLYKLLDGLDDGENPFSFANDDDIELFEDYVIDENNPLETIEDYQRAIDLFRDTKGEEYFEENKGYFWGMLETRPFMIHLAEQADLFWYDGQKEKAISQLQYVLELNPGDNQGIRYLLINRLLELNKLEEAKDLFDFYDEEYSANWAFSKLLFSIKMKQDKKVIRELYDEAIDINEHVVPLITGKNKIPEDLPEFYGFGDENEAIFYVYVAFDPWNNDKIAIKTLNELYKS